MLKTTAQVMDDFEKRGLSIAAWAREHGFKPDRVYQVLSGKHKPLRGESHRIAVTLHLKVGLLDTDNSV